MNCTMAPSIDTIINILTLFTGGGFGVFLTWRYQRKKARAEAKQAEAEAEKAKFEATQANTQLIKEIQGSYQQLAEDLKHNLDTQQEYNEDQKQYIRELKEDRQHLREERNELRQRTEKNEEDIIALKRDVARNGRMVECMRPFLCGRAPECKDCVPVTITAAGEVKKQHLSNEPIEGIEPGTGGVF